MPGASTLTVEVTHVSRHGFWLLLDSEELLLPFADFPWFRQATIEQLSDLSWPSPDHLDWPQLDVDLSLAPIRDPPSSTLAARKSLIRLDRKSKAQTTERAVTVRRASVWAVGAR